MSANGDGLEDGVLFSAIPSFTDAQPRARRAAAQARRILHICTRFSQGGSEQRLCDMVSALPDDTHHVIIGCESDLELAQERLPGAEITVEPRLRRRVRPITDLIALGRLRARMKNFQPDIVVTHQSKAGVLGRVAARLARVGTVVHSLSMADFGPGFGRTESFVFRSLERFLARWTSAYAVVGTDLAARFARIGVPPEKFAVIRSAARLPPNDDDRAAVRHRVAQANGLPLDRPWLLYVGSLDDRKGVLDLPILLQQTLQLSASHLPYLVVVGAGPLEDELRARLRKIGIAEHCRLLGYVEDPREFFVAADAFVLLSKAEGLPQVLVQSAAAGTPFVATDVDGADEMLSLGAAGSVVEPRDIVGAARALLPYLRWPEDRRGRQIDLSSWDRDQVRTDYKEFFDSLLWARSDALAAGGCVVAFIGSDGSGKSSLSRALAESFEGERDVVRYYMGSGDGPSSLIRWPLKRVKRVIFGAKGATERRDAVHRRAPRALGLSRAVWALVLANEKTSKIRGAHRAAVTGSLVVCDRYPQAQIPGTTDGPLLDEWATSPGRVRRGLADWERRPYERAQALQPHLVIKLEVDQATALARRPGHDPEALMSRRGVVSRLRFDEAELGVVEVDANRPFDEVFQDVRKAVEACLTLPTSGAK